MIVIFMIVGLVMIILIRHTLLPQSRMNMMAPSPHTCNCPLRVNPSTSSEGLVQTVTPTTEVFTEAAEQPTTHAITLHTFLLILMPIRPDAFEKRKLIRNTWYRGYKDSPEVMLRFFVGTRVISDLIGKELIEEQSTYNDVVFIDHRETPRALTNKTIALIKWASDNVNFTYMMKCDDDTYVYVDNVLNELKKRPTTASLYYGKMIYHGSVMRNRKFKWADPNWDLGETYMPYALGGGYILSSDLVVMLAEQSDYLKWHPNEDTAVGSWLVPYEYERRSDDLVCVSDVNGTLKYKCVEKFPIFHIFYRYPQHQSGMTYFHKLYNEYAAAAAATAEGGDRNIK